MTTSTGEDRGPTVAEAGRMWGGGWRRYLFPAFWLVYLGQAVDGVSHHSHGVAAVIGYALVAVFAAVYLAALPMGWDGHAPRTFWSLYAVAVGLTVVTAFLAGPDALVFDVYLAVLAVAALRNESFAVIGVLIVATAVLPRVVPGWGSRIDWNGGLSVMLVSFALYGFFKIIRSNIELSKARSEVARLAAENERSRIARDLHDLLGHSLTTITVKAALASRLADRDPARATAEISEVEQLSRRTLEEVRAAVAGYRDMTLAGELASAREVLRAAGIEASLPGAVDAVDADALEPFGWVVREAVTNIVRHSRAQRCAITVGPRWIEVRDNGRGGSPAVADGHGLSGLHERLEAVGGTLRVHGGQSGWSVRADLAPLAAPAVHA